ncbi:MAG: recombinase family protein [Desulfobacterales bacterium]|nr:recombinase family protein [Desulfobacterales bacterium]
MGIYAYTRVSSSSQNIESQKLAILEYITCQNLVVDFWLDVNASSQKSNKARRIDELLSKVHDGDIVLVSELSRLGRSVGQISILIDELVKLRVKVICLKENIQLDGTANIQTKVMITLFSLFAEIEQKLISERTKEGLTRAKSEGKILGRPKGSLGKSRLDGKQHEIIDYLSKGVTKANIAKICGVSWPTIQNFIESRGLLNR